MKPQKQKKQKKKKCMNNKPFIPTEFGKMWPNETNEMILDDVKVSNKSCCLFMLLLLLSLLALE